VTAVSVSIRSLRGAFAGEVSGLDITKPISAVDVAAIEAGMDAYAVLVFRDQHLTDEQQVAFTLNHFYTGTRLLTRRNSGIAAMSDRKGKTISTTAGTTNFQVIRRYIAESKFDINVLASKDHAEAMLLVESGRAAAFGMDDILLYGFAAASTRPGDWAVVGEALQVEPYAIMLRKDDPEFKTLVDAAMLKVIRSGEFEVLYRKWFQSPIPPRNVNLNVPMSDELRRHLNAPTDHANL